MFRVLNGKNEKDRIAYLNVLALRKLYKFLPKKINGSYDYEKKSRWPQLIPAGPRSLDGPDRADFVPLESIRAC